jgi:hypothetical protein
MNHDGSACSGFLIGLFFYMQVLMVSPGRYVQ